jgi:peptidoglycan-associated lipoprotein
MKKLSFAVVVPFLALSAAACGGSEAKKPVAAPVASTHEKDAHVAVTSAPTSREQMAVNVDDSIFKACDLKQTTAEQAPKFDFDSEQLSEPEKAILEQIAKCLTTGPLNGRAVDLVGRADPRGESEYNMTLGAKRARTAHAFLASLGVASDKLFDTSRGELDATGTDENGWRNDRRVDVKLRGN